MRISGGKNPINDFSTRIGVYQRDTSYCETKPEKVSAEMLLKLCAALNLEFNVGKLNKDEESTQVTPLAKKSLRF